MWNELVRRVNRVEFDYDAIIIYCNCIKLELWNINIKCPIKNSNGNKSDMADILAWILWFNALNALDALVHFTLILHDSRTKINFINFIYIHYHHSIFLTISLIQSHQHHYLAYFHRLISFLLSINTSVCVFHRSIFIFFHIYFWSLINNSLISFLMVSILQQYCKLLHL
jgi:hypothetical protein